MKLRRSTKKNILVVLLCGILITVGCFGTYFIAFRKLSTEYKAKLNIAEENLNEKLRTGYIATSKISSGDILTDKNVQYTQFYSSQSQDQFISSDDLGKIMIVDVDENAQITKSMVVESTIDKGLREVEYSVISLTSNLLSNDFCDVRISYPNGEDYIVLTKKQLKNLFDNSARCFLWLSEEEIQRMSSAIVDCYIYSGSYLYVTKYIEPNIQEESIITYTPTKQTINLIEEDPNIVQIASNYLSEKVRKELEDRLTNYIGNSLGERWDQGILKNTGIGNNATPITNNNAQESNQKVNEEDKVDSNINQYYIGSEGE